MCVCVLTYICVQISHNTQHATRRSNDISVIPFDQYLSDKSLTPDAGLGVDEG